MLPPHFGLFQGLVLHLRRRAMLCTPAALFAALLDLFLLAAMCFVPAYWFDATRVDSMANSALFVSVQVHCARTTHTHSISLVPLSPFLPLAGALPSCCTEQIANYLIAFLEKSRSMSRACRRENCWRTKGEFFTSCCWIIVFFHYFRSFLERHEF